LPGKENGGGGTHAFLGRLAEIPPENGLLEAFGANLPGWCAVGLTGAPLVELVGDFGQKRVSRGTLKRTWGAPVASGRHQAQIWRIWFFGPEWGPENSKGRTQGISLDLRVES